MSVKQILQLLDECREAHASVDEVAAGGRFSQFAKDQAYEADSRLVEAISDLFSMGLSERAKALDELERRAVQLERKLSDVAKSIEGIEGRVSF